MIAITTNSSMSVNPLGFNRGVATVRLRISGRVQGVGFRAFVANLAGKHGLVGEVWNWRDGDVGAVLEGDAQSLEAAVAEIRNGPGRVSSVVVDSIEAEATFAGFRIGRTR